MQINNDQTPSVYKLTGSDWYGKVYNTGCVELQHSLHLYDFQAV